MIRLISVKLAETFIVQNCNKSYLWTEIYDSVQAVFSDKFIHHDVVFRGKEFKRSLNST